VRTNAKPRAWAAHGASEFDQLGSAISSEDRRAASARQDERVRRFKHREIELTYRLRRSSDLKRRGPPSRSLLRLREIERVAKSRHGTIIPNNAAGLALVRLVARHVSRASPIEVLAGWARRWAPWLQDASVRRLAEQAISNGIPNADTAGWLIGLTVEERQRLEIRTIGAVGVTKRQRILARKAKAKARMAAARRAKGAKPREQYEAEALSTVQPWKTVGLSRSAWYRAGKPGTGPCAVSLDLSSAHAPVPNNCRFASAPASSRASASASLRLADRALLGSEQSEGENPR
jgi:hypothetical protein